MVSNKMVFFVIAAGVAAVSYFGWKLTARGAYESAEYAVLDSEGAFEIREYPSLMMATTNTKFDTQGNDGSFMRLFRYISGGNDASQKVAMTTPVFMQPDADEATGQMGFVIPREIAQEQIPEPSGTSVEIRERIGGRFAVVQFSGRMNRDTLKDAEGRLRTWMTERGLNGETDVETAGYDPPWTPGPLRRNEVLIRVN